LKPLDNGVKILLGGVNNGIIWKKRFKRLHRNMVC